MKVIRQQFHQEIIKNQKFQQFSIIRKQLLQFQQFKTLYEKIIENNDNLNILIYHSQPSVFHKYCRQVIDDRFIHKLCQSQKYFINNLTFLHTLLQYEFFPQEKLDLIFLATSQIVANQNTFLSYSNLSLIFEILLLTVQSQKYSFIALAQIQHSSILKELYKILLERQLNEYFFKIINIAKIISNPEITSISTLQIVNYLQLHILTSKNVEQLYLSYGYLAEIFTSIYNSSTELYDYASILNKTFEDIFIEKLVDPISFFLLKIIENDSIMKLIIEMNIIETLFNFIIHVVCKNNQLSVFSQQSIWFVFRKIVCNKNIYDLTPLLLKLNWEKLCSQFENKEITKYPYVKIEILELFKEVSKIKELKQFFYNLNIMNLHTPDILQQFYEKQ